MMKKFFILFVFALGVNLLVSQTTQQEKEIDPISYDLVEVKPIYPGGLNEFMSFVMSNYQQPSDEEEDAEAGVFEFIIVIGADGKVGKVDSVNAIGYAGKEVKRILSKCPRWTPGVQSGVNVPVLYKFSITIK